MNSTSPPKVPAGVFPLNQSPKNVCIVHSLSELLSEIFNWIYSVAPMLRHEAEFLTNEMSYVPITNTPTGDRQLRVKNRFTLIENLTARNTIVVLDNVTDKQIEFKYQSRNQLINILKLEDIQCNAKYLKSLENEAENQQIKSFFESVSPDTAREVTQLFGCPSDDAVDLKNKELAIIYCIYADFVKGAETFLVDDRTQHCHDYLRNNPEAMEILKNIFPLSADSIEGTKSKISEYSQTCMKASRTAYFDKKDIQYQQYLGVYSGITTLINAMGMLNNSGSVYTPRH